MKWLEIVNNQDEYAGLYRMDAIEHFELDPDSFSVDIFLRGKIGHHAINSNSLSDAQVKYNQIRNFCINYGPIPNILEIRSEPPQE